MRVSTAQASSPSAAFSPAPAQALDIITSYADRHASLRDLGRRYHRSPGTIRRWLDSQNVPLRGRGRPPRQRPPAPPAEILALHRTGQRPADISDQLGCEKSQVLAVLHDHGLRPNRGKAIPPQDELTAAFQHAGSVRALSQRYGISEDRLRAALDAADARSATRPSGQSPPPRQRAARHQGPAGPAARGGTRTPAAANAARGRGKELLRASR
jgi:transposase-like protein